jgi:hypothetical protein
MIGLPEEEAVGLAVARFGLASPRAIKLLKKGRIALKRAKDNQE